MMMSRQHSQAAVIPAQAGIQFCTLTSDAQ